MSGIWATWSGIWATWLRHLEFEIFGLECFIGPCCRTHELSLFGLDVNLDS